MRDTLHALALSPEQPEAQRTLARLLLEVPKELPKDARADYQALRNSTRLEGARLAFAAFASYLAVIPLVILCGIKSPLVFGCGVAATLAAAIFARAVHRSQHVGRTQFLWLLVLSIAVVWVQGTWLGPFVLLPTSATLTVTLFTFYADRNERWLVLLAGVSMFLVPFLADIMHWVPAGFSFEPGRVVLHERAIGLGKSLTLIGLAYTCTGYILLPVLYLGRFRDAMVAVESRQFLQAWYMKRMFPKAVG
jgi:eukaryotic-like serine/threonine-protein kinase